MRFKWLDAEPAEIVEHSGQVPDPVELRHKYERKAADLAERVEKLRGRLEQLRGRALATHESDEIQTIETVLPALEEELGALHDMLHFA